MRDRTADLLDANQTLSQLSYGPFYSDKHDIDIVNVGYSSNTLWYGAAVLYDVKQSKQGLYGGITLYFLFRERPNLFIRYSVFGSVFESSERADIRAVQQGWCHRALLHQYWSAKSKAEG